MRLTSLLFPTLFVAAAACAAPTTDGSDENEGTTASSISQACSMTRSKILASVTGERKTAITRGFTWLDANVPYSQSKTHGGYRTDCSGFVSMCWQAGTPGLTTTTFSTSSKYDFYGDYEELLPGDGIDDPGHHVVLFLGWNDSAHKGACVLEQASTASDMQFRVRTTSSLKSGGFKPFRPKTFGTDSVVREGDTGTGTDTGTDDTTPTTPTAPTCVPKTAQQACQAAAAVVECGEINDGCGGTVDCDTVAGFGCDSNSVCSFHMCQEKTPVVPPTTSTPDAGASTPTPTPSTSTGDSTGTDSEVGSELQTQGEPGDEWGSNNRTPTTAAGCSAAPGTSNGLGFAGVALAIAGVLARRRRK